MKSVNVCSCGEKFRMAEDWRDHLPCSGTKEEQLKNRIYVLETLLNRIFHHMKTMVCCGYSDWVDNTCKDIEGVLNNAKNQ